MNKSRIGWLVLAILLSILYVLSAIACFAAFMIPAHIVVTVIFGVPAVVCWYLSTNGALERKNNKIAYKFANNERYRKRILKKIRREADKAYWNKVKEAEMQKSRLLSKKMSELKRLEKARWTKEGKIKINKEEGKVEIQGKILKYSQIRYAEVEDQYVTYNHHDAYVSTNTVEHPSLMGAIIGEERGGIMGAYIGSKALGSTEVYTTVTTDTYLETKCKGINVLVYTVAGVIKIPIYTYETKVGGSLYNAKMDEARALANRINIYAEKRDVSPSNIKSLGMKPSVVAINAEIKEADVAIKEAIAATPVYVIPEIYAPNELTRVHYEQEMNAIKSVKI